MMLFESLIFNLLPAAVGIMVLVLVFESCWRKCPPDKLMLVSGAGKMRSVSGKGTFVIPLLQRVDTLSLGAVQVQLTTENDIPTQDAILIHACAVANFQIGQTPELIETASKNYLNLDKEEMTRQVTEVMLGKMREVIGQMDLKELMRDRESFNAKVFGGSKDDLANLGLELRTFNVQDFSDSQGIIRSMGADQAAEIKKEAELAQIRAAEEVAIRQNQLDLKQADLKKQADKAKAEADMVKATVTAEKQRELYIAQQEAEIAAETKKVELAERQADVRERELNATVKKQAEADRYAAEQAAEADLYKRTKQAEAEATRLKGESEGVAEKAHGEGVAAGIKAQAEAYNGMDNPYLLANRYIDIMPKVAEQVAKPLTAVDSIKMYGSGNAQKLVKETTSIVDQVASGLKDSTGIDLPSLLNGLISNPDIDAGSAENSVE